MTFFFLTAHPDKMRNVEMARQYAYAAGIKEGERWKYFCCNPRTCERTPNGFAWQNPTLVKISDLDLDHMMILYHQLIDNCDFVEIDYGGVSFTHIPHEKA